MKFESVVRNLSQFAAAVVIFFMAGGMYLSSKGFVINENGDIVLVPAARAQDDFVPPVIPDNYAFPHKHSLGAADAPVTLYEYSSFGCSHCADFHLNTMPQLKEEFIDKGLLRLVFVPFPIDKSSMNAALLAECVDEDKYFSFVEVLFKKQREWGMARNPNKVLKQYAALSGLPKEKANACLKNDDNAREILSDRQNGLTQLGIQGTPSFVIAANGKSEMIPGVQSYDGFKALIEARLPAQPAAEANADAEPVQQDAAAEK